MEAAVGLAALGLDIEDTVDAFVPAEGDGGGIPEDGDTFHLFHCQTVDGTFEAVHQDEDIPFTGGLGTPDIEGGTPAFLTLETGVLQGGEAEEFAIERIGEADGRGPAQLFGGDGVGRRRRKEFRLPDAVAQVHRLGLLVPQLDLGAHRHRRCAESQQAEYKYIA